VNFKQDRKERVTKESKTTFKRIASSFLATAMADPLYVCVYVCMHAFMYFEILGIHPWFTVSKRVTFSPLKS
jgi:hypothetical protein